MKRQEILDKFNTPSQIKIDNLRKHNRIMELQIKKNNKFINNLLDVADQEQNVIANKLDKTHPSWRTDLVKSLL